MNTEEDVPQDSLDVIIESGDRKRIEAYLDALDPSEVSRSVSHLSEEDRQAFLKILLPSEAAEIIERLPESQAIESIEGLEPSAAAPILHELPSDERADIVAELKNPEAVLAELDMVEAAETRELAAYAYDTAGGLMAKEFLFFDEDMTIESVVDQLRNQALTYARYDVQYGYVTTAAGTLVGVLRLRDLLLTPKGTQLSRIMIRDPKSVPSSMGLRELKILFDEHRFFGVPVLDDELRLIGVVERRSVEEALTEETEETYRRSQGIVGGEELRTMPLMRRSGRRLSWLSLNIVLNIMAASIIAMHQDTLEAVIALAVFLPIISDMSGCSGSQAVAVSMRELSLNLARPSDVIRVGLKEVTLGMINGLVLGLGLGLIAWLWKGNAVLGLVVGSALALNTVVAVIIGGTVPLLLKSLNKDPALASGPILTTVTDMCGFFLVLSFASATLSHLT